MPGFRHKASPRVSRNPTLAFKALAAVLVLCLYFIITLFQAPADRTPRRLVHQGEKIQWKGFTDGKGAADEARAERVAKAMQHTFWRYKMSSWGHDDTRPISGGPKVSRNGWGAFIVESGSTLSIMGLWDELQLVVSHIVNRINFDRTDELVDPFDTTIRYLGSLVSLVDLIDSEIVPSNIVSKLERDSILSKAVTLARKLGPAYDTPSGMPWPRVNFSTNKGEKYPPEVLAKHPELKGYDHPIIGPARAGSNILENRVLTRLTGDPQYVRNATRSWSPLVWSSFIPPVPGMANAPVDIATGGPVDRQYHWDSGHDSYYEYLIKMAILAPHDRYSPVYAERWLDAVNSLRHHLTSRSAPSDKYATQHLYMGKQLGKYFVNSQSHFACFAPGNIFLGAAYLKKPELLPLARALLDGCRHTYNVSATGIGPQMWSWMPKFGRVKPTEDATFTPQSNRQRRELSKFGFWIDDPSYRLRPEYVESLFYAWRTTGEERYRDWAWDVFLAIEKHCKTDYGYSALRDVMYAGSSKGAGAKETVDNGDAMGDKKNMLDETESYWVAETLKYFWLLFADVNRASLDRWVFSTEGHLFRMIRQ